MTLKITTDTVFALSTPVGGAIAVIRATGKRSYDVLKHIFSGRIEPRVMAYGKVYDGENSKTGRIIDEAMAVYFRAPNSYTGEDMFELNLHGSYAVVSAVSSLLVKQGLRQAEPGEFTKRAFLNGKMDLIQADAVMDLVLSETEKGANAALDQLSGGLSKRIASIEETLIDLSSELSAAMDYPEEMEDEVLSDASGVIQNLISQLETLICSGNCSKILREGAKVVILGRPNAGKSSLMNALTGTHRAIVTKVAGTTRDVIEERVDLNGLPIRLVDTAGIHETDDEVEGIGIERAIEEARTAELVLNMIDGSNELSDLDLNLIDESAEKKTIFVINKADLSKNQCEEVQQELQRIKPNIKALMISCETGEGLHELVENICRYFGFSEGESAIVTNERHIECLKRAKLDLEDALLKVESDLISVNISSALMYLGEITGREANEAILDRIFSRFCVGK